MEWVEVNGAGRSWVVVDGVGGGEWSWVELSLAIPKTKLPTQSKTENFKEHSINIQK